MRFWKIIFLPVILTVSLLAAGCFSARDSIRPPATMLPEKELLTVAEAKPFEIIPQPLVEPPAGTANPLSKKHNNVNIIVVPEPEANRFLAGNAFVTRWNILGPFTFAAVPAPGPELNAAIHREFMGNEKALTGNEKAPDGLFWQLVRFKSEKSPGAVSLGRLYPQKPGTCAVVYAVTYLKAEADLKDLILYTGGNGYLKVWINRKLAHTYNLAPRESKWDQDMVPGIELKKGFNLIVVKALYAGPPWEFYFRLAVKNDLPVRFLPQ